MSSMFLHAARLAMIVPLAPLALGGAQAFAGQLQMMPGPTPDADALAAEMRILGNDPFDLPALISAGERTLKLGDMEAAAAFFQRAERISPANGRIKAGKARTLVQLGRPGEALRFFGEAESLGYDVNTIAAERALAFDLIGEQERAQRTYRLALKRQNDDETQRRYALSLGISGKREAALEALDPLLRRSDRAAWRVRAFVLAMTGDVAGANRIAASMLPAAMATGLQPFFQILPTLAAADRAFAVHFGEVRPTAERVADARMIPALPVLAPEPVPVVQLAAAPARTKAQQRRDRNRRRGAPVEVAALVPPAFPTVSQLPPPPRVVMVSPQASPPSTPVRAAPVPSGLPIVTRPALTQAAPAGRTPIVAPPATTPTTAPPAMIVRTPAPAIVRPATVQPAVASLSTASVAAPVTPAASGPAPFSAPPRSTASTPVPALAPPTPVVTMPTATARVAEPVASPSRETFGPPTAATTSTGGVVAAPSVSVASSADAPSPVVAAQPKPVASDESVLARIISTIGVPAAELEVAPVKPAVGVAPIEPVPAADPKTIVALDKKAAEKKALADKAAAEKKLADKKLADEKAAKAKALKADPVRIWVQVAGGSSVRDLPREWARLRGKAPAAFQGKIAYSTPLRFTNRVLTGPFKTEDAAQDFVNQIARFGLTGFVFTSEAGQKIDKLPAK